MKTELKFHNPDNLETAGDPPWRFCLLGESIYTGDQWWCKLSEHWKETACNDFVLQSHLDTYRTRRPLPAPQPGGGGEAEEWICRNCGKPQAFDGEHLISGIPDDSYACSPTPPIALPVRAEAGTPRVEAMKFWALTSGIIRGSIEVVKVEDAKALELETAALSRELEEGREGRADFIKLLASTLGVETDRQDYIVMHIQSLRAELEEAKAEVAIQKEAYETAAADRKFTAELSEQQAEQINGLQQQLTALRAAPRSETEGREAERTLCNAVSNWLRERERKGYAVRDENEVAVIEAERRLVALARDEKGAGE